MTAARTCMSFHAVRSLYLGARYVLASQHPSTHDLVWANDSLRYRLRRSHSLLCTSEYLGWLVYFRPSFLAESDILNTVGFAWDWSPHFGIALEHHVYDELVINEGSS